MTLDEVENLKQAVELYVEIKDINKLKELSIQLIEELVPFCIKMPYVCGNRNCDNKVCGEIRGIRYKLNNIYDKFGRVLK